MYRSHFGLGEAAFSVAPDPRFLYMSRGHQEALAHLLYGVSGDGGFVLLTGEVGAGKTTICRCLLEQVPPNCDIAYIFNPKLTVGELLSTICSEFGVALAPGSATVKAFVDSINAYLLDAHAKGRHAVLIIDEAQSLSADVLEQMRLLTNLETSRRKLLQIILLGQPELAQMLDRPELRQLAQRIVARYHLGPLSRPEVASYVQHRLDVSGARRQLFPPSLMGQLYRLSRGIPRLINVLCDRALLGAYVQGKERVDRPTLRQAAREVFFRPLPLWRRLLGYFSMRATPELPAAARAADDPPKPPAAAKSAGHAAPTKAARRRQNPAPSNPLRELAEWPAGEPRARSKAMAYAALFRAWGAEYAGSNASTRAAQLGLRCGSGRGGLDELRRLNRPALLRLHDRKGRAFYATLTGLDGNSATLTVGSATQSVDLGALGQQWSGHYTILWRLPPFAREVIWPGECGPAVEWLDRQLALTQGTMAGAAGDAVYDDLMVSRVKQFQRLQGLLPDGAAGAQTLMYLSGAADPTAPGLAHEQAEN